MPAGDRSQRLLEQSEFALTSHQRARRDRPQESPEGQMC